MKVFVDAGAYKGDTIEQFYNWGQLIGDPKSYKIFAIEPSPDALYHLNKLANQKDNITVIEKAAWVANGYIDMYVDLDSLISTTVMESKAKEQAVRTKTQAFDLSAFISEIQGNEIIVKMDIEGAEFPVLEKMLKDDTLKYIKILFVEFHPNKVKEYTTTDKKDLIRRVSQHTKIMEWH